MAVKIIGLIIGILVLGAGIYYIVKKSTIRNPKKFTPLSV